MRTIQCKYNEKVLVPDNGIAGTGQYMTLDGQTVLVRLVGCWNNTGGYYEEELDALCQKEWGISFQALRSIWIGRLGRVGNYWHVIEMTKI